MTSSHLRFGSASAVLVIGAAVLLGPALGCRDSASGSPSPGTASSAEVHWPDGGGVELAIGDRVVTLPANEVKNVGQTPVMQDEQAKRLAYVRTAGDVRFVYLVGSGAYLGPVTKAPIDFKTAPDLEHALGTLFDNGGARRAQLVADVTKESGEGGVARMLEDASTNAKDWDDVFAKLSPPRANEVRTHLAKLLEAKAPTSGLRHAVAVVPLREPARAPVLAARVKELTDPIREPRASAVMLRALAVIDKPQGASVACGVLGHKPLDVTNAKGTPEEIDVAGRDALVEAAVIAIAAAGTDCGAVLPLLGPDDACIAAVRCGEAGPLSGHEATKQDEPLCTKDQLTKAITDDLARSPADVLAQSSGTRTPLFVYATLAGTPKLPAAFTSGHARRQYALVQPKDPACESGVAPNTPCHCDEAVVRDQACRHPEGTSVSVGLCKFEIDDKQKKLLNVVATLPP